MKLLNWTYATFLLPLLCALLCIKCTCQRSTDVANLVFAGHLLKELVVRYGQKNIVVSPYFIQRMLILAMYGAKDDLREDIQNITELRKLEDDEYLPYFKKYPSTFLINNQMLYNSSLQLRKIFTVAAEKYFDTVPQAFADDDAEKNANFINRLVEQGTRHFNNFLDEAFMQKSLSGLFLNTVYFKDHWQLPFDRDSKRMGKFLELGQKMVDTICLYGVRSVGYADLVDLNATAIQLPFKNAAVQLLILLPNQGAKDINWSKFKISEILEAIEMESVAVSLPLFTVETHIDLSTVLINMGLKSLFALRPNFLNAFQSLAEDGEVEFLHAAEFDVSEYGSNMKMAHEQTENDPSKAISPRKFFLVERPFVFILHSNEAVHMVGRITLLSTLKNANIRIKGDVNTTPPPASTSNAEEKDTEATKKNTPAIETSSTTSSDTTTSTTSNPFKFQVSPISDPVLETKPPKTTTTTTSTTTEAPPVPKTKKSKMGLGYY